MSGVEKKRVAPDEDGMRLDRWFAAHYPGLTYGRLQKLLRTGQVRVDGGRAKANTRIERGQEIRVPPLSQPAAEAGAAPAKALSERDIHFVRSLVIHKDDDILALNKPPGLAVQGGSGTTEHLDRLLEGLTFEKTERPRLVHRLDKDTSGVMLLARSRDAAAKLGRALKHRSARKLYWALVIGVPKPAQGEINLPLIKRGGRGDERVHPAEPDAPEAKHAVSRYAILERAGRRLSWLAMTPITGRTHQLRAHAAAIGHPIVGDGKYGGAEAHPGGEIPRKLHLHARRLTIPHPRGGMFDIAAPLPQHMLKTWEVLGFDPEDDRDPFADED
ncbi:RluA family pseudouridine synthase [Dichotomicrobium thermohalophilum]|nr:RluA family pseudouridine synthase [Dichotomicrobium thermohalophilum]